MTYPNPDIPVLERVEAYEAFTPAGEPVASVEVDDTIRQVSFDEDTGLQLILEGIQAGADGFTAEKLVIADGAGPMHEEGPVVVGAKEINGESILSIHSVKEHKTGLLVVGAAIVTSAVVAGTIRAIRNRS